MSVDDFDQMARRRLERWKLLDAIDDQLARAAREGLSFSPEQHRSAIAHLAALDAEADAAMSHMWHACERPDGSVDMTRLVQRCEEWLFTHPGMWAFLLLLDDM